MSTNNEYEYEIPIDAADIDEQALENRGRLPSGYYRAICDDIFFEQKDATGHKLKFHISRGPFAGREITDTLWNPDNTTGDTDEEIQAKRKKAIDRALTIFKRLGAREDGTPKCNLKKPIGVEFVLHLVRKKDPWCETCQEIPSRQKGDRSRKCPTCGGALKWVEDQEAYPNVDFDGIYPTDHPKIPVEVRTELELPPSRSGDDEHEVAVPVTNGAASHAKKPTPTKSGPAAAAKAATSSPTPLKAPAASAAPKEERLSKAMAGF